MWFALGFAEIVGEMPNLPTFNYGAFPKKYSTINQGSWGNKRSLARDRRDERGAAQ
jgi:hypothetical protein